jgi:hypothetical protein
MELFPAAQDALDDALYDPRLPNPFEGWLRTDNADAHIRHATLHLHHLQASGRHEPHLTQAILRLLMALEMRILARNNGDYRPRRRCSRCHWAEPLRGQWACQACITAYGRERKARRAAQQAAEAIAPTAIQVAAEVKPSVQASAPVAQKKIGFV